MKDSEIEIINRLPAAQFKNFCFTFFESLGLTNIESAAVPECGYVTGRGTIELGILMTYHFVFLGIQHAGVVSEKAIQDLRDIMENKKTYLYLKAIEFSKPEEKELLIQLFSLRLEDNEKKIKDVKEIFNSTGASDATQKAIQEFTLKAFDTLEKIDISNDKKAILKDFGQNLMNRKV